MKLNILSTSFILLFFLLNSQLAISQRKINRSDYKNEIFASAHFTGYRTNIYGIGYEYTVLKKKRDYYSIRNELTTSILPKGGIDGSRLLTLLKWNRESVSIISLGLGTSFRLNSNYNKFSFVVNNAYKYNFKKHKINFSGNILLLLSPPKPNPTNGLFPHTVCVKDCSIWGHEFRLGASVGKYF